MDSNCFNCFITEFYFFIKRRRLRENALNGTEVRDFILKQGYSATEATAEF